MNPFNKFEAVGIFVSVAIMALALGVIRFKTEIIATADRVSGDTQSAVVAVSETEETEVGGIEEALKNASSPSGELIELVVDDVVIGSGDAVRVGDTVTVHYIGTTQGGIKFDSSYDRGEPFTFTLGEGRVIAGWEEGLIGMKEGGNRILVIPPSLGYGNRTVSVIPPNSTLVFAVELVSID
jgi:FKBP-type peptidyl-prolyl cis-trans isomerase